MKNAFILFSTVVLVFIFSILTIKIFENKAISSQNIINQYNYIQGNNHLSFLEEYINSLENLSTIDKIQIEDEKFEIIAFVEKIENKKYELELIVKSKEESIRLYKKVEVIK